MTGSRQGFAAAVALYMLVAIAGLAAASSYAVVGARRAASRATRQAEAAGAGDARLQTALEALSVPALDSLPIGALDSAVPARVGGPAPGTRVFVIRLTSSVYWIASVAAAASGTSVEARSRRNLIVEVLRPDLPVRAALTSGGPVSVANEVKILGDDTPPPGWGDCPPTDTTSAAAIIVPMGTPATFDGGPPIPNVREADSASADVVDAPFYGRVRPASLAARATLNVESGAIVSPEPDSDGDCQHGGRSPPGDWGDPLRTGGDRWCERFFPVINAVGDLSIARGRGQGLLLVAGTLRIEGPFLFTGVIIARGGIDVTGPDVRIYGAVASLGTAGVRWGERGELRRSTCVVARVSEAAARAYPVPLRAWSELF
jgi:hypothetical protein